jgi:hypothetical protein
MAEPGTETRPFTTAADALEWLRQVVRERAASPAVARAVDKAEPGAVWRLVERSAGADELDIQTRLDASCRLFVQEGWL